MNFKGGVYVEWEPKSPRRVALHFCQPIPPLGNGLAVSIKWRTFLSRYDIETALMITGYRVMKCLPRASPTASKPASKSP